MNELELMSLKWSEDMAKNYLKLLNSFGKNHIPIVDVCKMAMNFEVICMWKVKKYDK
jgi:hypothetical protein